MVVQGKTRKSATKAEPPRPSPVSRIDKIASLKRYPDKDYALDLLHQMARAVAPIIHEYKFKVGTLCEMYPKNACLLGLNVNRGQKILVRLRPPHNDRTFYPMSDLIGTLLHELTHNVHGPHDARFYALLDELRRKYETGAFLPKDYVCEENTLGAGFQAPWATPQSMRQKRLEALSKGTFKAEARRLGGKAPPLGDLRKAMLEAAERRLKDAKWCSHGSDNEMPDSNDLEIIELDDETEESSENTLKSAPVNRSKSKYGVRSESKSGPRPDSIPGKEKYKEVIDLTQTGTGDGDDEIEIISIDACEEDPKMQMAMTVEPKLEPVLRPSLLDTTRFSTSGGHFEMRSTVRYFVSSSPGRTFIGDGLSSIRRKVVADLNFDHIIESTSYIEVPRKARHGYSGDIGLAKGPRNTYSVQNTEEGKPEEELQMKQTFRSKSVSLISQANMLGNRQSSPPPKKRKKKESKGKEAKGKGKERKQKNLKQNTDTEPPSGGKKKRASKEVRCVSFQELFP